MVVTTNDSNSSSSSSSIRASRRQVLDFLALPETGGHPCQFCSKRFLTLQGLGGHQQDSHPTDLNFPPPEEPLNLEERVQALTGAIRRTQRHVLRTSRAMAPGADSSSSSSYNVDDDDDEDDYIITMPNFFGSDVTPRPHAHVFGDGDETPTEVLPPSSNSDRLFGFCLDDLVKESYLMYPPPGFAPLVGESSTGAGAGAQEGEGEGEIQGDGDTDKKKDDNEKPLHEELDLTLKL